MKTLKNLRTLSLASFLVLMGALVMPTRETAFAALIQCRSDPVILLSDGTVMDVSADIGTLLIYVTEVNYTVHVPAGVSVVAVISTPSWPTTIERFQIYADNPAGQYTSATLVRTVFNNTEVTANMLVTTLINVGSGSRSGYNGQTLNVSLFVP